MSIGGVAAVTTHRHDTAAPTDDGRHRRVEAPKQSARAVECEVIDASTPLDSLVFSEQPWFDLPLAEQQRLTHELVQQALDHHLANCPAYAAYYDRCNIGEKRATLGHIPLVSTRLFKHAELRSVPSEQIEQWYLSSGTNGPQSRIGRDRLTLERLLGSVRSGLGLVEEWHEDEMTLINLGPGREHAGNVWFQYVMSLVELMYATHSVMVNGTLEVERACDLLAALLGQNHGKVGIVGPPFMVLQLCSALERRARPVRGGDRLTVMTAGGWKRHTGVMLPRPEFEQQVAKTLGLASGSQLRDAFNQVELNTAFLECSAHQKHVPPWVYARARDARTVEVLPPGQLGILSYLDASAKSYPSFIIADDVGKVHVGRCACGREGTRVEVVRRLDTRTQRGCALAMDKTHE